MRELILQALRESVKAYPEIKEYLSGEALLYYWIDFTKIGEAPDDDIRRKDERRLTRNLAKFLEGQLSRLLTYVRTHEIKGIQPSFWEDETAKLWAEYGEDFVGILMHGVEGGINLLPGHGTGYPIDQDRINTSLVRFGRQYRDKWLSKIDETSRQYVEEMITDWSLSGQPLSNLIKTLQNDQRSMFNKIRAERIAVTETTRLHALGNQAAWEEVGAVTQFRWNSAQDELVCDICRDGVDNSPYPLDQLSEKIPAHVNCRCWGTPIVSVEEHERDIERLLGMGEGLDYQSLTIPEFASLEEGMAWMRSNLITDIWKTDGTRLTLDTLRYIARTVKDFEMRTRRNAREIVIDTSFFKDKKDIFASYDPNTKRIYVRGNGIDYINKLNEKINNGDIPRSLLANPTFEGMLTHELAHAIDDMNNQMFSKLIKQQVDIENIRNISSYALSDWTSYSWSGAEAFAEAVALYISNQRHRLSQELINIIEKVYKK